MNSQQDISLWESFRSGDRKALGNLFRKFYPILFQFGSKVTNNTELCKDSIEELFIDLWENRTHATQPPSIKAYLLKGLKYLLLRAQHKLAGPKTLGLTDEAGVELSYEALFFAQQENEERSARVVQALEQLANRQKEIIYLKYYQQLTFQEVSDIMDIDDEAARDLLFQSVTTLKSILADGKPG